jgi:hypothetical protein
MALLSRVSGPVLRQLRPSSPGFRAISTAIQDRLKTRLFFDSSDKVAALHNHLKVSPDVVRSEALTCFSSTKQRTDVLWYPYQCRLQFDPKTGTISDPKDAANRGLDYDVFESQVSLKRFSEGIFRILHHNSRERQDTPLECAFTIVRYQLDPNNPFTGLGRHSDGCKGLFISEIDRHNVDVEFELVDMLGTPLYTSVNPISIFFQNKDDQKEAVTEHSATLRLQKSKPVGFRTLMLLSTEMIPTEK